MEYKKLKIKKWITLTVAFILMATMCMPIIANADNVIIVENGFNKTVIYSKSDKQHGYYFDASEIPYNTKKVKVTSSKKSVATVEKLGGGSFFLTPKKAGKTKITIKGVVDGKTVKCTGTVKVVNFQRPFKTLKIGGKSYLKKIKSSYNYTEINTTKSKVKIEYKVKSGWKLADSLVNGGEKLKNGKSYSLGKDGELQIYMCMKNKKNGAEIVNFFYIYKK